MMRSLFAGASGLRNHQIRMDVIGDNIANVNTLGYKASRVQFSSLLAQTLTNASAPADNRGGTNPMQVGLGSTLGAITSSFVQGSLQSTGTLTDLSIEGDSLFVLGNGDRRLYTRAGSFRFDANGLLTDPVTGYAIMGYNANADGTIASTAQLSEIVLPLGQIAQASATTRIGLGGNLNADSQALGSILDTEVLTDLGAGGTTADGSTLITDLGNRSGSPTQLIVGDIITINAVVGGVSGTPVSLTVGATTTLDDLRTQMESMLGLAAGAVSIEADGRLRISGQDGLLNEISDVRVTATDATGTLPRFAFDSALTPTTVQSARDPEVYALSKGIFDSLGFRHNVTITFTATDNTGEWSWEAAVDGEASILTGRTGTVQFGVDGTLDSWRYDDGGQSLTIDPGNGGNVLDLDVDPGSPGSLSGMTQFAADSTADVRDQDGFAMGVLESISIDSNGVVTGVFSNGLSRTLAQIAAASFANTTGLQRAEGNTFSTSPNSGEALIGTIGNQISGRIMPGTLEMSNVDLALEFTNMVIAQRGFQANARIITTADDMLNELVNLKR